MDYISAHTCIDFYEDPSATNRVLIVKYEDKCWSTGVGMHGGVQNISLGERCDDVNTAVHEIIHTLGVEHTQRRDDRDKYITVDTSCVPVSE
ncbi:astacin [Cooperia oncophora]